MRQLEMGQHVKNVGGRMHLLLRQDQYVTGLNICFVMRQLYIDIDTLQLGPMQVYVHTLYTSTRVCDDVP